MYALMVVLYAVCALSIVGALFFMVTFIVALGTMKQDKDSPMVAGVSVLLFPCFIVLAIITAHYAPMIN